MKKDDFVTRTEYAELRAEVNGYRNNLIKLMEDRLVCLDEIEAIKDQMNGRPARPPGGLLQILRKERGMKALELKKGHVLQMVPKPS